MVFVFLACASFVALIYPYVLYPLALRLLRKSSFKPPVDAALPNSRAALLFCAYNEERALPEKIQNIRAIKALLPHLQVRAYTDGCTDDSVALLRRAQDVLTVHEGRTRAGKATGMRTLVDASDVDLVIFTDANVTIEPESVGRLISYFANPEIGTVAGTLQYTNEFESSTAHAGSLYWRLEETIKRLESETGSTMGADGSLFATRKGLYVHVPANLLDDMISSISPLFGGHRVVSAPDVRAHERATTDSGDEFRRKRRIACRAYNTHRYLRPQLRRMSLINKFKYVSHKYIRWFSGLFLILTVVFTLGAVVSIGGATTAIALATVGSVLAFVGMRFEVPVVSSVMEMASGMVATGLGVLEAISGRDYQTWVPARNDQT